jgi:hypothetical protein
MGEETALTPVDELALWGTGRICVRIYRKLGRASLL